MALKIRILPYLTFNTKSSQIPRTCLWPFSQTFGLVYSPLNSAKLSCLSEVTLLWSSALAYANYVSLPFTSLVFQKGFLLLLHVGTLKCSQDHQCSCASSLYLYLCSSGYLFSCGGSSYDSRKLEPLKLCTTECFLLVVPHDQSGVKNEVVWKNQIVSVKIHYK